MIASDCCLDKRTPFPANLCRDQEEGQLSKLDEIIFEILPVEKGNIIHKTLSQNEIYHY